MHSTNHDLQKSVGELRTQLRGWDSAGQALQPLLIRGQLAGTTVMFFDNGTGPDGKGVRGSGDGSSQSTQQQSSNPPQSVSGTVDKVEGDKITVSVTLFEGEAEKAAFAVEGAASKLDELAAKITVEVEKKLAASSGK